MTSATCYQIRAGAVTRLSIPAAGLRLPVSRREEYRAPTAFAGGEHPDWAGNTLGHVAEIATRLTPWANWFCAPVIPTGDDRLVPGTAYVVQGSAWVLSSQHTHWAVFLALHEAAHLVEEHLTPSERDALYVGIVATPTFGPGDYNEYYASPIEIRANAFASWAMAYWLRGRLPEYHRGQPADEAIWTAIYRGDIGLRVARRNLIPADRMPAALRLRLAERGDGQKLLDALRPLVMATWSGMKAAAEWVADAFRPDVKAPVRVRATS
jgi:hypothetical protein